MSRGNQIDRNECQWLQLQLAGFGVTLVDCYLSCQMRLPNKLGLIGMFSKLNNITSLLKVEIKGP